MNFQGSYLGWISERLGPFCGLAIPLTGLGVFCAACFVVMRSRRPAMIAAWLILVPLPFLIGFQAALFRRVSVSAELSMGAPGGSLTNAQIGEIASRGLVPLCMGLIEVWPAFFVLTVGLIGRIYQSGLNGPSTIP